MSIAEKLTTIAENQQKVYDAGHEKGHTSGYEEGHTAGYTEGKRYGLTNGTSSVFWRKYMRDRSDWAYAFAGSGWNDDTFYPPYPITLIAGTIQNVGIFNHSAITDLKARLDEMGVVFDTSKASNLSNLFYNSAITRIGTIDAGQCPNLVPVFASQYPLNIEYIEKLKLSDANIYSHTQSTFMHLTKLTEIRVEGTIYKPIYFQWSPLSVDSMKSIISCLTNYTGTSGVNTATIKFSDNCWAALEASIDPEKPESLPPDGGASWKDYVFSTLGWNT